ncbi:MAG: sulfatase-like hydrolase/transferase, partial [Pseudomonadota bacterium]
MKCPPTGRSRWLPALAVVYLAGCGSVADAPPERQTPTPPPPPNFLILVADDLGVDSLAAYGENPRNASTPSLDRLMADGMRFTQFWAQPTCSPTRASTLTGRYAFRTGVSEPLWAQEDLLGVPSPEPPAGSPMELDYSPMGPRKRGEPMKHPSGINMRNPPPGVAPTGPTSDEVLLPAALKRLATPYATAAFGKWHLADRRNGWLDHPNQAGFDHFSGLIAGAIESLFAWQHVENGQPSQQFGYVDQYSVDAALDWITRQPERQPWFVWLSFVNPHEPFHKPPASLLHSPELKALDPRGVTDGNTPTYFRAQVEAMDSLVGQLLDGLPPAERARTYVIWFGDNGDERWARSPSERRPNRFKSTLYQGGIHVPLVIAGPGISAGSINHSMAHVVDVFGTVLELAGASTSAMLDDRLIDAQSFAGQLLGRENADA